MPNDIRPLKPYLDDIAKHDGSFSLNFGAALADGAKSEIAKDIAKTRQMGLNADADAIQAWVNSHKLSQVPLQWNKSPNEVLKNAEGLGNAVNSGLSSGIGAFFNAHIWIRVGEVAIGLILIAVGVAKLTNAVPIATKIARYAV